ncbi:MAG: hypothetical protein ACI88G_002010 [Woeseiaceae bacterium]|jgi:hypothetical protein
MLSEQASSSCALARMSRGSGPSRLLLPLVLAVMLTSCGLHEVQEPADPAPTVTSASGDERPPDLRLLFRQSYDEAIDHHRESSILSGPLIIQDLLSMTLIRPSGERLRFEMDKTVYFTLADNTHPPYGIYSIIALENFGPLSAYQLKRLSEYRKGIELSLSRIATFKVDDKARERLRVILESSGDYIDALTARGIATRQDFDAFIAPLRPLFRANFHLAALEQLRQFRKQMEVYREQMPEENWADLRVVVMGFHQPRNLWALKQFFQWLLEEPDYEHRVVYAEFQVPFFGENRDRAEQLAIELATKVDFDLGAAQGFLNDQTALGSDILGPYAKDILKTWGASDFRMRPTQRLE